MPSISGDRVTPRFVIRYKPSDQSSIYASFTRGYKAALIDAGGTCQNASNIPTPTNPTGAGRTCNNVKPEASYSRRHFARREASEMTVIVAMFDWLAPTPFHSEQFTLGRAAPRQ